MDKIILKRTIFKVSVCKQQLLKKTSVIFLAFLTISLLSQNGIAQKIYGLKVGDKVPDIIIPNLINSPVKTVKISDFKDQLLILDFWATWCSSCLENFPKMEELQSQFEGKIKILATTSENEELVRNFLLSRKNPNGQPIKITTVVGDKILTKLFPHQGIPHIVWISPKGVVTAITGAEEVTAKNILEIINGRNPNVNTKLDIDIKKPLFLSNDYPSYNRLLHYSILSKSANPGLPSGSRLRVERDTIYGRVLTNRSLLEIYEAAARQLFIKSNDHYSDKRLILNVRDSTSVTGRFKNGKYDLENQYNYDFIVPLNESDSLYSYMMQDLNKYTGYTGKIENRKVRCYTLIRTNRDDKIKTAGGQAINTLFDKTGSLINCPVSYLVNELNSLKEIPLPVVDGTDYKFNVDIHLSGSRNLNDINKDLSKYNLQLKEDFKMISMLIVKDRQ